MPSEWLTAEIHINFGKVYESLSNNNKSLEYYQKSLKIYLSLLGQNHINIAITYNNIAVIHYSLSNYIVSLDFFKKALKIYIEIQTENHLNTDKCYSNIGEIY